MALADRYTVEPIWEGRPVVIIGGGPSLSLKQIHQIGKAHGDKRVQTIAVNDAIYPAFWADWLHAGDLKWWRWHIQRINRFPGIRTTLCDDVPQPWINGYLEYTGDLGFDPDPSACRSGGSSVYQAICIATHAGAKRIILVGVDMKFAASGDRHWFGEHPERTPIDYGTAMAPKFDTLKAPLDELGVHVVNCSPGTMLETFEKGDLEKFL